MRTAETIKEEIERRLGFFPPFFAPALDTPEVLENFWQQTLSAYVDNPLPALFKEKLLAYLGRYCGVPYCIVCHSCALRRLGMTGPEVLALLESPPPLTEADEGRTVATLAAIPGPLREWLPHSAVEASLLSCSARVFLTKRQHACAKELLRVLDPGIYSHLMAFLAYVKTCHIWIEAHPELSYDEDSRARQNLAGLIEEEPRLAEFFREYPEKVEHETEGHEKLLASEFTDLKGTDVSFRGLLESAPDAMVIVDKSGRIRLINAQVKKIFGYGGNELLGKPIEILIPQRFRESHTLHRAGYSADPHVRPMGTGLELYGLRKDGREIPVAISLGSIAVGGETLAIANIRDITEKKNAENALLASEEHIRLLMKSTAEAIYGSDLQGRCTFINASCLRILGYSQAVEVLGKSMHELIHHTHEDGTAYPTRDCPIYEAFQRGAAAHVGDEVMWRSDGTCFAAEYWSRPVRRGEKLVGVVVTFLDITERKQSEADRKRLSDIVEATPDLVAIVQWTDSRLLYMNTAGRRMLGIREDEDVSTLMLRDFRSESAWRRVQDEMVPALLREGVWSGEIAFLPREGREVPVSQVAIAHSGRDGSVEHLSIVAHDISESRRLETQLRQSQKMEAIGRLAGGIAHDFNNLLTIILGHSSLVMNELPPGSPTVKYLEQIRKAGDRAVLLTRQMLAFSRKQVLRSQVLNLNAAVSQIEDMLRRLIGENIELITIRDPNLGNTMVDPGQMDQIILNLAANARDAMPNGGMLTIETGNVEMDASFSRKGVEVKPGPYVMLSFSDNGSGMDSEALVQVFEPFFTTKELGKGTGFGLATVYGIVKQSGGYIWVYSEPGRGTTFKIYLPAVSETDHAEQAPVTEETPLDGCETILLVEDEEMIRTLACTLLRKNGYTVLESEDCGEALKIARQYEGTIHLLLTDVVMPQMSGPRLAEEVRLCREAIRVLFMSGYAESAVQNHGLLDADSVFLEKPFTAEAFLQIVRRTLDAPKELEPERAATILVVDDEEPVRNVISGLLQQAGYKVVTAGDAIDAGRLLEMVAVDLVITDVLLPYKDGIDFSAELRRTFPELKIIAMSGAPQALKYAPTTHWFDDVLIKPPSREHLLSAVNAMLRVNRPK